MLTSLDGITYKSGAFCEGGIISPNTGHCNLDFKPVGITQQGELTNTTGKFYKPPVKNIYKPDAISTKPEKISSNNTSENNYYLPGSPTPELPETTLDINDYSRINQSGPSGNSQDNTNLDLGSEVTKAAINMPFIVIASILTFYILGNNK